MKKIFATIFATFLFFTVNLDLINAEESIDSDVGKLNESIENVSPELLDYPYSIAINDQEVLFFESKIDYESYLSSNDQSNDYQTFNTGGYITKPKVISSQNKSKLWIGYHSGTPEWRYASSHTLNKGRSYSVSGSYTYSGYRLSTGFSHSVRVSSTFPANSKRASRLGVRGDFTFQKIKSIQYRYGKPTGKVSYYGKAILRDKYIMTVYK